MDPDMALRARCLDMALRGDAIGPAATLELAAAMERFIRTGNPRREPVAIETHTDTYLDGRVVVVSHEMPA